MGKKLDLIVNAFLDIVETSLELDENGIDKDGGSLEGEKWVLIDEISFYDSFKKVSRKFNYQEYIPFFEKMEWIIGMRDTKLEKRRDYAIIIDYQRYRLLKELVG
nr:hypothetical protein [uncultured Aminipila sp.]